LSIKIKKTKSKQVVFEFIVNLNKTSLKNSFARFYDLAIKFFRNSKLSTRLSSNNVINFHFIFVRASFIHIFLKNEKRKNTYKQQERICDENEKDCASQILYSVTFSKERKCFEQFQKFVYE